MNWFEIKNKAAESADLYFYGDICGSEWERWTEDDACPKSVIDALKECEDKDLNIYINSGGGSVFGGIAIYNVLKRHKCKKTVYIDGIAASIASVIAMAGDEIIMPSNAMLMIHKPYISAYGANADELRKTADSLDVIEKGIINVYGERLADGVTTKEIAELMAAETWLTADEAVKYFKITVSEAVQAAACVSNCFTRYEHTPEKIAAKIKKPQDFVEEQKKIKAELLKKQQMQLDLLNL